MIIIPYFSVTCNKNSAAKFNLLRLNLSIITKKQGKREHTPSTFPCLLSMRQSLDFTFRHPRFIAEDAEVETYR